MFCRECSFGGWGAAGPRFTWAGFRIKFQTIAFTALLLPVAVIISFCWREVPWPVWAAGFAGLIAAGFAWQERGGSLFVLEQLRPLGDCSYTLYVIHVPIVMFISGWLMSRSPTGALLTSFAWTLLPAVIIPFA